MNEEMSIITIPAGTCGNRGDVVFTSAFPITSELLKDIAAHIAMCEGRTSSFPITSELLRDIAAHIAVCERRAS